MAKNNQDTPKKEKFGRGVGGGSWICPEISRSFSKVVVLTIV